MGLLEKAINAGLVDGDILQALGALDDARKGKGVKEVISAAEAILSSNATMQGKITALRERISSFNPSLFEQSMVSEVLKRAPKSPPVAPTSTGAPKNIQTGLDDILDKYADPEAIRKGGVTAEAVGAGVPPETLRPTATERGTAVRRSLKSLLSGTTEEKAAAKAALGAEWKAGGKVATAAETLLPSGTRLGRIGRFAGKNLVGLGAFLLLGALARGGGRLARDRLGWFGGAPEEGETPETNADLSYQKMMNQLRLETMLADTQMSARDPTLRDAIVQLLQSGGAATAPPLDLADSEVHIGGAAPSQQATGAGQGQRPLVDLLGL